MKFPPYFTARGWASVLMGNKKAEQQLRHFFARPDTFSLGVCNGCQLLVALGVVPGGKDVSSSSSSSLSSSSSPSSTWLSENESGRFESRFVTLRIEASPSVLLRGMEGAVLGVWSAHGEGRVQFKTQEVYKCCRHTGRCW